MSFYQDTNLPSPESRNAVTPTKQPIAAIIAALLVVPIALTYGLATTNEMRVAAIVVAALGALLIIARPFWGLVFFVALLYTRPEETFEALQGMRLPLLVSLLTLGALTFQKLLNREPAIRSPQNGLMVGFLAAVTLSTLGHGNNTVEALQDMGKLVILALLVVNLVSSPARYRIFVTALLIFTGYLALYSIYLFFSGQSLLQYDGAERSLATGIFGDPNDLAATIVAGLALVLGRIREARSFQRYLYIAFAALLLWAILMTNSRGGMLALLTVVGGFCLIFVRQKLLAIVIAVVAMGGFLTFGPSRMTTFDSDEESANNRFWFWANGVEMWMQQPILGIGYNQFVDNNGGYTAHNSYVLCFTETGTVGYFCWLGCIYYSYRRKLIPAPSDSEETDTSAKEPGDTAAAAAAVGTTDKRLPVNAGPLALVRKTNSAVPATGGSATKAPPTPVASPATVALVSARLALTGFLVAAYFLSRTFNPVLYLLITLPIACQISYSGALSTVGIVLSGEERRWDTAKILGLCFATIIFIYIFALKNR